MTDIFFSDLPDHIDSVPQLLPLYLRPLNFFSISQLNIRTESSSLITGRPPTTRRETYLRNLLSVVSKFPSFGIVEIGRPRYLGVHDKEYLDSRRQALFVGEAEHVKQRGLTMTFYPSPGQWRAAINILGIFWLTFYFD